ncbi:hypothetical protein XA68_12759 [Ophiocordyceps unilateralis]|uniref:Uncharacterized protein n=1 Tax=Ophiocordyceps unilateralis TaxID=268505 RepID=A0A2A9PCJ5_OPHUN|nr:hypothetical protein XA68_12759 [Ophiocordyceps unilateralis]
MTSRNSTDSRLFQQWSLFTAVQRSTYVSNSESRSDTGFLDTTQSSTVLKSASFPSQTTRTQLPHGIIWRNFTLSEPSEDWGAITPVQQPVATASRDSSLSSSLDSEQTRPSVTSQELPDRVNWTGKSTVASTTSPTTRPKSSDVGSRVNALTSSSEAVTWTGVIVSHKSRSANSQNLVPSLDSAALLKQTHSSTASPVSVTHTTWLTYLRFKASGLIGSSSEPASLLKGSHLSSSTETWNAPSSSDDAESRAVEHSRDSSSALFTEGNWSWSRSFTRMADGSKSSLASTKPAAFMLPSAPSADLSTTQGSNRPDQTASEVSRITSYSTTNSISDSDQRSPISEHAFSDSETESAKPFETIAPPFIETTNSTVSNVVQYSKYSLNRILQLARFSRVTDGDSTHSTLPARASSTNSSTASVASDDGGFLKAAAVYAKGSGTNDSSGQVFAAAKASSPERNDRDAQPKAHSCSVDSAEESNMGKLSASIPSTSNKLPSSESFRMSKLGKLMNPVITPHANLEAHHQSTSKSAAVVGHFEPGLFSPGSKTRSGTQAVDLKLSEPTIQAISHSEVDFRASSTTLVTVFNVKPSVDVDNGVNSTRAPTISSAVVRSRMRWGSRVLYLSPTLLILNQYLT